MRTYYDRKKKQGMKFRVSFVLLFVFASFAVCFAMYMRSDDAPVSDNEPPVIVSGSADEAPHEEKYTEFYMSTADINPIAESAMLDKRYFDDCMFAGDSLMVGLGTYGIMPEERIAAAIGMSVMSINDTPLVNADGSEILASEKINNAAPKHLYILLGLNLMDQYTNEQLLAAYGDFIDSINRENTDIYVISVPPVTEERENNEEHPILNDDIDSFNAELLKFANNRGVYYVDLNSALKGEDGKFSAENAESDGIHFKKATYDIMLEFLLTHVHQGS